MTSPHDDPFATTCVHAGGHAGGEATPPLAPPIVQASVFETPTLELVTRALDGEAGLYSYSRHGNPTVATFEAAMAALEGAEAAVAAASGMGVVSAVLAGLLAPGQLLVTSLGLYGATQRLMDTLLPERRIAVIHSSAEELADGLPAG